MEQELLAIVAYVIKAFNQKTGASLKAEDFDVRLHWTGTPWLAVFSLTAKDETSDLRVHVDLGSLEGYDAIDDFKLMETTDTRYFDKAGMVWHTILVLNQRNCPAIRRYLASPAYRSLGAKAP